MIEEGILPRPNLGPGCIYPISFVIEEEKDEATVRLIVGGCA